MQKSMFRYAKISIDPPPNFDTMPTSTTHMKANPMTTINDLVTMINTHPALDRKPVTPTTFKSKGQYVDLFDRLNASANSVPVVDTVDVDATPADDDKYLTVKQYAFDVNVDPKTVRHALRLMSNDGAYTRYRLTPAICAELDKRFVKS